MTCLPRTGPSRSGRLDITCFLAVAFLAGCGDPGPVSPSGDEGEPVLTLVSFTMNEILDQTWSYAPLVTLAETSAVGDAWVVKVVFEIPGLGEFLVGFPGWGGAVVPRACTAELFPSGASDDVRSWEITFDSGDGARSSGGEASATVYFVDAFNRLDSLTVRGPIVRGSPATASAGALGCPGRCG